MFSYPEFPRRRLLVTLTILTGLVPACIAGVASYAESAMLLPAVGTALTLMAPPTLIVALLLRHPTWTAIGMVQGYALSGLIAALGLFGFVLLLLDPGDKDRPYLLAAAAVTIAPFVAMIGAAWRTGREYFGETRIAPAVAGAVAVYILYPLTAFIGPRVHDFLSLRDEPAHWGVTTELRSSVYQIQGCATKHALAKPAAGYPRSLAELGPDGDRCVSAALAKGNGKRIRVEYTAAAPDSAGRIPSFVVRAYGKEHVQPRGATGKNSKRVILGAIGDESGLVREADASSADALTTLAPSAYQLAEGQFPPEAIAAIRNCALLVRSLRPGAPAPASIAELSASLGSVIDFVAESHACNKDRLESMVRLAARSGDKNVIETGAGYGITYAAAPSAEENPGFTLQARPMDYGRVGIRSYFLEGNGALHVTLDDRAATTHDPIVPPCDDAQSWRPESGKPICVPLPSAHPPTVALVHDPVVVAPYPLRVAARDAQNPALLPDSSYRYLVMCTAQPETTANPKAFNPGPDMECSPGYTYPVPIRDSLFVTLFVRDRTGSIGRVQRVVRVTEAKANGVATASQR